jgi:ubiquitin-protein ligase
MAALAQNEDNEAITQDIAFVQSQCLPSAIVTLSRIFITVQIMRTPYARIQLRVQFTDSYPTSSPIVDLTSPTLPPALLRNKEKECKALAESEAPGAAQFATIYRHVHSFVQSNMFVPCWKEMKQVATHFTSNPPSTSADQGKGTVAADDKTGVLKIKISKGNYKLTVVITVPTGYPAQGVTIAFLDCNFTPEVKSSGYKAQSCSI